MKQLKRAKYAYLIFSAIFVVLGVVLLIWPIRAQTLCLVFGILCLGYGAIKMISYFVKDIYALAFQFDLAHGIFTTVMGALLLLHPQRIVTLFPVLIGVMVLIDAVFKLQTAMDAKRFGIAKWWLVFVMSVISAVFGLILIVNPFGESMLMIWLVCTLMINGVQNLFVALYTVGSSPVQPMIILDQQWEEKHD